MHRSLNLIKTSQTLSKTRSFGKSNPFATPLNVTGITTVSRAVPTISQNRSISSFPNPQLGLTEEQQMLYETAYRFAQEKIEPHAAKWDNDQIFPVDVLREAAELGFGGIYTRDDVGGSNLSRLDAAIIFETLSMSCPSTTAYISIHNMCCGLIDTYGTPEQRQKYLPDLTSMKKFASYCLTEPGSGSDAASLSTKATKKGNSYILNGSKAFISGGGDSDVYLIMVRTGDNSPKGISCVLVEKGTPGLSFGKKEHKLGWNSQPTRAVILENCEIPQSNLIGKEGEGFKIAMRALDGGRVNIAACSLGGAQRSLDTAVEYTKNRKQFGKPISSFQSLQFKMADAATKLYASRLMVRHAASLLDANDPNATSHCAMAKVHTCAAAWEIVDDALQMHGGYGYLKEYPVERIMRDLRVHRILEGTEEVMKIIISRNILKD